MYKRIVELIASLSLIAIAGLTFWVCWEMLSIPNDTDTPRSTLLAIVFVLGFVACAGLVFAARLAVPRLRVDDGRIIGIQGMWRFFVPYAVMALLAFWHQLPQARITGLALVLGFMVRLAWRSTFRAGNSDPPDVH